MARDDHNNLRRCHVGGGDHNQVRQPSLPRSMGYAAFQQATAAGPDRGDPYRMVDRTELTSGPAKYIATHRATAGQSESSTGVTWREGTIVLFFSSGQRKAARDDLGTHTFVGMSSQTQPSDERAFGARVQHGGLVVPEDEGGPRDQVSTGPERRRQAGATEASEHPKDGSRSSGGRRPERK